MSRKDYIELAKILNDYQFKANYIKSELPNMKLRDHYDYAFDNMLEELASFLKTDNRRFEKQKFINAVKENN